MRRNEIQRAVLEEMRSIFYSEDVRYVDWMGYPITNKNKPSYHHIEKACELRHRHKSDLATKENGDYLGKVSHEKLGIIEHKDKELYEAWNYLFTVINNMGIYPIDDVWKMVYSLKEKTESVLYEENVKKLKKN